MNPGPSGYRSGVTTLPSPRGPISELLLRALRTPVGSLGPQTLDLPADPLADEDLQVTLYACYELHYRGFDGVDPRWEWDPALLALRGTLEHAFEEALGGLVPRPDTVPAGEIDVALREIAEAGDDGTSLSKFIEREAGAEQVREFLVHRSAYQLKEADPHSWALPRLWGRPKAAMVEIQADEYGGGRADRIHAALFARSLRALGLDDRYGAYLDLIPATTLATVNLMSLFGLHRRLRGAIVGHLAAFEMTSSVPNGRYGAGLRRLGFGGDDATAFFDEHVTADAVHESIAAVDLAGGLAAQEPQVAADILWGAAALVEVELRWSHELLEAFGADRTSLRAPLAGEAPPLLASA